MNKQIIIPLVGGLVLIIIIGVGGIALALRSSQNSDTTQSSTNSRSNLITDTPTGTTTDTTSGSSTPTSSTSTYKDGTYDATGTYFSPGGKENIGVSLTIKAGTVSAVTVTPNGPDFESERYESQFASGVSAKIVGKKIDEAFVSGRINGSSLTGEGFNNALTTIINEAKV